MNVRLVSVGKIGSGYEREGVKEYGRRLSKYINLDIIEVNDEKTKERMSVKELMITKQKEGVRILSRLDEKGFICALDINGAELSTEQFADFINTKKMDRTKELCFIIGGSVGLSEDVLKRADVVFSFSKLTFPHGLMRIILLEQIYRAEKILHNEPYHK